MSNRPDHRHHVQSHLMRESLVDTDLLASTESPVVRMLPDVHVVKIGATTIIDRGQKLVFALVAALREILKSKRVVIGTGGGLRSRHVFSIGIDLGLPTGVLAQLCAADALGNAHILGTLLAPDGVVAIPPEMFGHLLPPLIRAVPGVIFNGVPPYSLWEHPPALAPIPPHRTAAATLLFADTFACRLLTLVTNLHVS